MSKQPHTRKRCGAKTRSGKPCKNGAMANGRCRMHGGKATGPPKENQNAKKHGFFSKYIPQETLEIMNGMGEVSPADLIWDQIQIQYAAIIRAQKIMFVEDSEDHSIFKTKEKSDEFSDETAYEIHASWDRHATFLNAQSRAMSELRSLIKQFNDLAHDNDERKLKLQLMQANIDKVKAETKNEETGDSRVVIVNDKEAMRKAIQNDGS